MNTPEQIQNKPFFYKPFFIPPKKNLFAERALRFDELADADESGWCDYLRLLADVCRAQDVVLNHTDDSLPQSDGATRLPESNGAWIPIELKSYLTILINELYDKVNPTIQAALNDLATCSETELHDMAKRVLCDEVPENEHVFRIWLHSVLQCVWTAWASQLRDEDVPSVDERSVCPCCGGEAVASVVLNGGDWQGLRYLHCAMCNSRWNALRAKCTFCGDQSAIALQHIEGAQSGVLHGARGESCGKCGSYRKLFLLQNQQYADPIADDLASLAVDILLGSEGIQRGGHNPFLLSES